MSFFQATVESVPLYGCEPWALKPTLQKSLDGCFTRMLRVISTRTSMSPTSTSMGDYQDCVTKRRLQDILVRKDEGDGDGELHRTVQVYGGPRGEPV